MKSKNTDSVMELKKILDQMIREEFRDAKDRRQVVRVELLVCDEDIEAARSLKPLYMKTSESPYIYEYDEDNGKILLFYIPAMKIIYEIRNTLEAHPEVELLPDTD